MQKRKKERTKNKAVYKVTLEFADMLALVAALTSGLLSPSLLRVIGQGPAQRAVVARATTPCALPTWFNSDWVDERSEAFSLLWWGRGRFHGIVFVHTMRNRRYGCSPFGKCSSGPLGCCCWTVGAGATGQRVAAGGRDTLLAASDRADLFVPP